MSKVLVIQNHELVPLGNLTGVLEEFQFDIEIIHVYQGKVNLLEIDPYAADLLVVLGGTMGVYESAQYPFLKDEMWMIRVRIEKNLPVLGLCLGAQLIAKVMGQEVMKGEIVEAGFHPIRLTEKAKHHTLFEALEKLSRFSLPFMHGDTFDLPASDENGRSKAVLYASSEQYQNQIFSFGSAWGIQPHPEVDLKIFLSWLDYAEKHGNPAKLDLDTIRKTAKEYLVKSLECRIDFWRAWLREICFSPKPTYDFWKNFQVTLFQRSWRQYRNQKHERLQQEIDGVVEALEKGRVAIVTRTAFKDKAPIISDKAAGYYVEECWADKNVHLYLVYIDPKKKKITATTAYNPSSHPTVLVNKGFGDRVHDLDVAAFNDPHTRILFRTNHRLLPLEVTAKNVAEVTDKKRQETLNLKKQAKAVVYQTTVGKRYDCQTIVGEILQEAAPGFDVTACLPEKFEKLGLGSLASVEIVSIPEGSVEEEEAERIQKFRCS